MRVQVDMGWRGWGGSFHCHMVLEMVAVGLMAFILSMHGRLLMMALSRLLMMALARLLLMHGAGWLLVRNSSRFNSRIGTLFFLPPTIKLWLSPVSTAAPLPWPLYPTS